MGKWLHADCFKVPKSAENLIRNEGVTGSSPVSGTISLKLGTGEGIG